jgi:SAM-dependent methyltransferase
MTQRTHPWEQEYRSSRFLTKDRHPQKSVQQFFKFLKKQSIDFSTSTVLDSGCGTGRNALFAIEKGVARAIGYDIAPSAIREAQLEARALHLDTQVHFEKKDIATPFTRIADKSIDIVLDVTASQCLTTVERNAYLAELTRVMKPGAYLFLRTLAKDGDDNAKWLLKHHPAKESDMYTMPKTNITERVFTRTDLEKIYSAFTIIEWKKTTGYNTIGGTTYKRNYFLAYMQRI